MEDLETQISAIQTRMYNASHGQFRGHGGHGGLETGKDARGGAQQQQQPVSTPVSTPVASAVQQQQTQQVANTGFGNLFSF